MPTKKKSTRGKAAKKAASAYSASAARLRETWESTLSTLAAAQKEGEKQLKLLVKKNRLTAAEATAAVKSLSARLKRERKKATRELEGRLATLQARFKKESKNVGHVVNDAVHSTLAALNIPSRKEVAELTRKVDELSRKIDGFRRSGPRPSRRSSIAVAAPAV